MQNQHFRGIGGEKEKEGKEQQQEQHLYRDGQMKVPSTAWEELRKEVSVSIQPNVQKVIVKQTSNNHPISFQHTFI